MATDVPSASAVEQVHGQRRLPGEMGIWIFVFGDLAVFTLFFVLVAQANVQQNEVFQQSRRMLDFGHGLSNTLLLLTGSWLVALSVEKLRHGRGKQAARGLLLAILCGAGFVINKMVEWSDKIGAGITPATNDFFMLFFVFCAIHLFHVVIGLACLLIMRAKCTRPIGVADLRFIESGAIFWHLVDLLWILLFCLFYLI